MISREYCHVVMTRILPPAPPAAHPASPARKGRSSGSPVTSAAAQPPLTASARLVGQAVVLEDRLLVLGDQLAVGVDRGRVLYLLLGVQDLEVPGTDSRPVKGHEHKPAPAQHSDLDGAE